MSFKKIIPLAFMVMISIFAMMFMVTTLAATDEGVDMNGSVYEDQYTSITTTSQLSMTILEPIALFLAVIMLIVVVVGLRQAVKNR